MDMKAHSDLESELTAFGVGAEMQYQERVSLLWMHCIPPGVVCLCRYTAAGGQKAYVAELGFARAKSPLQASRQAIRQERYLPVDASCHISCD